jgi:hypothetical protein
MYEPHVYSLSLRLMFSMPPWIREKEQSADWQDAGVEKRAAFTRDDPGARRDEEHF